MTAHVVYCSKTELTISTFSIAMSRHVPQSSKRDWQTKTSPVEPFDNIAVPKPSKVQATTEIGPFAVTAPPVKEAVAMN
jgi:hypothetical protein